MKPGTAPLAEVARHLVIPTGITSTGWPRVRDTCSNLSLGFDRWQADLGRLLVAKRADRLYAADTTVLSVCRQAGKTYLFGAVAFALCLLEPGLTVIWTAHRFKTARETFNAMKALSVMSSVAPHIARVNNSHGEEAIEFINGSRVLFGAREQGFGLGFAKVGMLILDEGQRLTARAMDDLVPTTNAHPNPLIVLAGTPPRPTDPGEVFAMLRQEAIEGESDETLFIELSADRDADLDDREQWRKANPSYPHRTSERAILRMRKNLSDESFRREALGIWDEQQGHRPVLTPAAWAELADVGPADGVRPSALAVDASHEREISIAACWAEPTGAHVEEVWAGVDEGAAQAWLIERAGRRIPVLVDVVSPAASLAAPLKAQGVKVRQTTGGDMAKACGLFLSDAKAQALTHAGQPAVSAALQGARKRAIGNAGAWGWNRKDPGVNIAPLVAVTLARFGASATRPKTDMTRRSTGGRTAILL